MRALNKAWRLAGTALSFMVFGLGALLLAVPMSLNRLLPGPPARRARRGQHLVHLAFRLHLAIMQGLGVMRCQVSGGERLNRPGQLVIANHPSLIDVVCLVSRIRHANCIVKASLRHNPFTRWPVAGAGFISNRDPVTMVDESVRWLRQGGSMVIFPEGTRSEPGQLARFQRGAANIALRADAVVTPVFIHCSPATLTKGTPWYRIPTRRFTVSLRVGDDIDLTPFTGTALPLAARRLTEHLQHRFSEETHRS
ncbi:lysophospholipid acyltransferase family protein [Alloalcanivorax mobilis]|uniref:lysophospholipid acyltransferase family protein n=1 Tax=Alloalcanivorax mobilis TaxID=2019569 RepID=UPI000C765458|nr:lysophospholipid acyltransferase family protein [Alloalcanivorax mobilis]